MLNKLMRKVHLSLNIEKGIRQIAAFAKNRTFFGVCHFCDEKIKGKLFKLIFLGLQYDSVTILT